MWENILSIIAVAEGTLALGGILYSIIYWKGGIDTWRKAHEDEHKKYPISEMSLMCNTLWECYGKDALRLRPDLAHHSSPYKLTRAAMELIPDDIKKMLRELASGPVDKEALATGYLVVKHLGVNTIENVAKEKELSIQETIAILSTYVDNAVNNGHGDY